MEVVGEVTVEVVGELRFGFREGYSGGSRGVTVEVVWGGYGGGSMGRLSCVCVCHSHYLSPLIPHPPLITPYIPLLIYTSTINVWKSVIKWWKSVILICVDIGHKNVDIVISIYNLKIS